MIAVRTDYARKLAEEARNQETEAVKSYGGFGTFEPLGPIIM